jgi:hypothetical protein
MGGAGDNRVPGGFIEDTLQIYKAYALSYGEEYEVI